LEFGETIKAAKVFRRVFPFAFKSVGAVLRSSSSVVQGLLKIGASIARLTKLARGTIVFEIVGAILDLVFEAIDLADREAVCVQFETAHKELQTATPLSLTTLSEKQEYSDLLLMMFVQLTCDK
jgi:hypothetical protein